MPPGVEDLGGIGIKVVADASQIRKGFESELKTLTSEPTKIPIVIDDEGKIRELKEKLAGLDVPITVKINRETARSLKRDIQNRLEGEGGVFIPVKVKNFTSGEAQRVRDEILSAIGPLEVDLVVRWRMEGGPGGGGQGGPAGFFFRPGGGGGGAGGGGPTFGSAVRPPSGAPLPIREDEQAEQQTAANPEPVSKPTSGRGSGRRRSRFKQLEGESEAEHRQRLREMQVERQQILETEGTDTRKGIKAYNDLIALRKRLGEEGPTVRLPYPREGQDPYPERVDTAGRVVRGGPKVGRLASEVRGPTRSATGSPEQPESAGPVRTDADLTRRAFGVEFDEFGTVKGVNEFAGKAGLTAGMIERYASSRDTAAVRAGRGFRGQKATRSPFGAGLDLTPEQIERRRVENATRIAEQLQPDENIGELVKRLNPRRDARGRFLSKGDQEQIRADRLKELLGPAFTEANAALEAGDLPTALRTAGAARGALLGGAFAGQIEGVGKGTAKRYLDPKRDDIPPNASAAQLDWITQMDALGSVMQDVFRQWDEIEKNARRSAGGQAAAATRRGETTGRAPTAERVSQVSGGVFEERMRGRELRETHAARQAAMRASFEPVEREAPDEDEVRRILANAAARFEGREPEPITAPTIEEAAGGAGLPPVGPGTVSGGDEGFFVPFGGLGGGGGGPVDVVVQNWPQWMTSREAMAAGPFKGLTPGQQEQAVRGTGTPISDEDMAAAAAGVVVPAKTRKRKKKTAEEKEVEEQFGGRARSFSGVISAIQSTPGQSVTEQEIEGARAEAQQRQEERERGLRAAQEVATTAVQESPSRAVAVAAGQFFQSRFGGRTGILTRKQEADRETAKALATSKKLADAESALALQMEKRAKITDTGSKAYRKATAEIEAQQTAVNDLSHVYERQATVAEAANKRVATSSDILKSFTAGVGGTIVGQILFQGVLGAAQKGVELFNASIGASLERMAGYHEATRAITTGLSDQTRASQGAVKQTVAQAAAQTNLNETTFEAVRGSLEQRAAVEAGNKAYQDQIKLIAASGNVGAQQQRGFDEGLFRTTGGVNILGLQTPIGGTASTQELIGQQLEKIGEVPIGTKADLRTGNVGDFDPLEFTEGERERQHKFEVRAENLGGTLDDLNRKFEGSGLELVDALSSTAGSVKDSARVLTEGGAGGIADQLAPRGVSLTDESLRALEAGGPEAVGRALQIFNERDQRPDAGVLLAGLEERILPALQYQIRQNLQNQLETFLPAQRGIQFLAQPQAPFGRGLVPGGGAGISSDLVRAAGPLGGALAGASGVTGINGRFGGVPSEAIQSFNEYRNRAQDAIDAINAKAAEGERVLAEKLGVPESSIAQLRGFGEEIGAISQKQADIRLDIQFSQYNRQLFIAKRTLGDLAALTGREGGTFVGQLQRQDLLLSRRSQQLSLQSQQLGLQTQQLSLQSAELGQQQNILQLELAQRRVNFQRAAAGFTAPGTTPEERAARIEEAKIEADYAQREIDFQRQQLTIQQKTLAINREQFGLQQQSTSLAQQQFANQIALQDALNNRGFEDQAAAIAEMQKAFEASQQLQALENLKQIITTQRDLFVQELEAQVSAEEEFIKAHAQFTSDIISQTGEFVQTTVTQVGSIFNKVAREFAKSALGRFLGAPVPAPQPAPAPSSGEAGSNPELLKTQYADSGPRAAGFSGRINSPTRITVGEAGNEEIAIVRNPREVFAGGGGGGSPQIFMPVTITGNNIRTEDESEIARWADLLTRAVEQRLGQRARMLGFGPGR